MTQATSDRSVTPDRIMQMAWGYAPPLIIGAAIRLRLFDLLDAGPKNAPELARAANVSERGARAIANALVGLELLVKDERERYSLTPESAEFLVMTKPSFQGGIYRHIDKQLIPKWLALEEVV